MHLLVLDRPLVQWHFPQMKYYQQWLSSDSDSDSDSKGDEDNLHLKSIQISISYT